MARYFNEQTLLDMRDKDMNYVYDIADLDQYLAGVPADDVAPKSEVAMEIIAEIAPHCTGKVCHNLDFTMGYLTAMNKVLAELAKIKQKYTEEK